MKKVFIPEPVLPGFKIISSFTQGDVGKLTSYLKNIPVGDSLINLNNDIEKLFDFKTASELLKTIMSFNELIGKKGETFDDVAKNLSESYNETVEGDVEVSKIKNLEDNLLQILKNYKNLGLSLKARDLMVENENNFQESRIISDLRLVFDDELENKKRHGVIIHRLHIEYRHQRTYKDIYVSLDLQDLQQLKEEIERAIKKHEIIKNDYKDSITFVL